MKTETLTSLVVAMRNKLQPQTKSNLDPMIHDYEFFTQLASFADKEREKARDKLIAFADKPADFVGTMIRTENKVFIKKQTAPVKAFSKDEFIEKVATAFKIDKFKLKELATASVVEGKPRTSYIVEDL